MLRDSEGTEGCLVKGRWWFTSTWWWGRRSAGKGGGRGQGFEMRVVGKEETGNVQQQPKSGKELSWQAQLNLLTCTGTVST